LYLKYQNTEPVTLKPASTAETVQQYARYQPQTIPSRAK